MKLADFPQIHGLPVSAKLEIVGELWDEIARDPGALPIPEWHIAELINRLGSALMLDADFSEYADRQRMHIAGWLCARAHG